jgi:NAD(P)-dependent dehydrogenase (short-subunit alcohol dehydrogenase family)
MARFEGKVGFVTGGGTFEGKVGFVTGGGTGIGLACARAIVEGGGRVMLAARREPVLREASAALGERATWVCCDVTDEGSVDAAVAATVERLGPLTLAVNSAASGSGGPILRTGAADFARALETDLVGVYRCLRAEARAMREAGGGSIVNISSIAGTLTHPWMTSYCVSKAGVNMLTRCAADDLGALGIRVNAVMPSLVDTPLVAMLTGDAGVREEYLRRIPLARLGDPDDVGRFVAALLSDDAGWVTGQCIGVDGGHTLRQGPDLVPFFQKFLPREE